MDNINSMYNDCHEKMVQLLRLMRKRKKSSIEDISGNQFLVIKSINPTDRIMLSELSSIVDIENSNITGIVDALVQKGILKRYNDPEDRRVIRVKLTKKGKEVRQDSIKRQEDFANSIYGVLEPSEIEKFIEILNRLINTDDVN